MNKGRLTVIMGGMFSGKTSELLQKLERKELAGQKIQLFKPDIDGRYSQNKVCSHTGLERDAICIDTKNPVQILDNIEPDTSIIGIEEVQFFDDSIMEAVNTLLDNGIDVVVSGLDLNYRGETFGLTYMFMAYADFGEKLNAVCKAEGCDRDASRTQRLINGKPAPKNSPTVLVGEEDFYEARCRDHHIVPE